MSRPAPQWRSESEREKRRGQKRRARQRKAETVVSYADCVICGNPFVANRKAKICGSLDCKRKRNAGYNAGYTPSDAARLRGNARRRNREHIRRATVSDITAEQELAMRQRTRKCRLCGVYMTSKRNLPNSKHLDHIVPINQGGTHTHGNVRIICADCNLKRPKDGSDYTGQVTLWAYGPDVPVSRKRTSRRTTCRKGLHPWVPENIRTCPDGKRRCRACEQEGWRSRRGTSEQRCQCGALFAAPGAQFMCPDCIDTAAHRAAELHASGLSWKQVAAQVGYTTNEGARYAAKRIGYVAAPQPPKPKPQRACPDCGKSKQAGSRICTPCTTARAWQAVAMHEEGCTLRVIADRLGYSSITSVTNLMTVAVQSTSSASHSLRTDVRSPDTTVAA